jgi:predicted alpha/beta-fold hydrolase
MISSSSYRASVWLPGGHAQTIYPLLIRPSSPNTVFAVPTTTSGVLLQYCCWAHPCADTVVQRAQRSLLPSAALLNAPKLSVVVQQEMPCGSGHVGFVSGPWSGRLDWLDRKSTRLNSSHNPASRMPSSA